MTQEMIKHIKNNPKYKKLTRERSKFAWKLSIIMLVLYYSFILIIAFNPSLFGMPISENTILTLGIPVGIIIIIISFILAGVYVNRANGEFDELTNEIKTDFYQKFNN